jgi:hypothetical protein
LADDLRRALEALQLTGSRRGLAAGPELILDEGGVRVEVEDTAAAEDDDDEFEEGRWVGTDREWGEEEPLGGPDIWVAPTQSAPSLSFGAAFGAGVGVGGGGLGGGLGGPLTPSGRIMPTARPPQQTE